MHAPRVRIVAKWFAGFALAVAIWGLARPAAADIVHNDDVIIRFSLNVGNDSVVNRAFGFDTVILSENNLRVFFEDTSVAASFPTNDWRIVINDSSNGGRNYYGIQDDDTGRLVFRIEAGARQNALYVEQDGDIGIGTDQPTVDVHVQTGNTPTYRMAQDNSSGFQPQSWDVAGNETNFFVRDATNGSTLPFRIRPGAPTSAIDIAANGNIGINTASPSEKLHIRDTSPTNGFIRVEDTANGAGFDFIADSSGSNHLWRMLASTANRLSFREDGVSTSEWLTIQSGGNIGVGGETTPAFRIEDISGARLDGGMWLNASSRQLKQDIRDIESAEALEALMKLSPVEFAYKSAPEDPRVGFIAEDVPDLVASNDRRALSSMEILGVVTRVVKDQQQTIAQQQQTIEQQQADIRQLNQRLEKLEAR